MASKVYFTDMRSKGGHSLLKKLKKLIIAAGINEIDFKDKFTVIKIHFGEPGNLAYIRPNYANTVVDYLKELGAKVYLSDSNTLYSGGRGNGVDHLYAASANGFNLLQVHAPVVIADGIKGTDYTDMPVEGGETCQFAKIGTAIADADIVISMTHFKGHEQAGFGGALKNLGMGAASVGGKMFLHSESQPFINGDNCVGCRACIKACRHEAISINQEKIAQIDYAKCTGCGQCVATCQFDGAQVEQNVTSRNMNRKIAEYTKAILAGKPNFHISLIMDVSPECDCWGSNDAAIVPNIGFAASFDPVALDQACADLVMQAPIIPAGTALTDKHGECCCHDHAEEGRDLFKLLHPNTDWKSALEHGEKIGLGTRDYELITI